VVGDATNRALLGFECGCWTRPVIAHQHRLPPSRNQFNAEPSPPPTLLLSSAFATRVCHRPWRKRDATELARC
jgi:hypothetical protein